MVFKTRNTTTSEINCIFFANTMLPKVDHPAASGVRSTDGSRGLNGGKPTAAAKGETKAVIRISVIYLANCLPDLLSRDPNELYAGVGATIGESVKKC